MSAKPAPGLRVLLLEDDPLDAELVHHVLQRADPAGSVLLADGRAALLRALDSFDPDVILSDTDIGGFTACEALQLVRDRRPGCPFLLVAGGFEPVVSECLKAGAATFVARSELSRLWTAIRGAVELRAPLQRLSRRQREVLHLLVSGCSTREAARRMQLSVKTVETHRSAVMRRLEIRDLAGLVRYAILVGLISAAP